MRYRLILMRHAKSSWDAEVATDHERPLNARGRRDAPRIGERLVELGWSPAVALSSDATRTRETYELMSPCWPEPIEVEFLDQLYHGSINDIQAALARLPDECSIALVLGHNPGWEHASAWLCGEHHTMTTANAALLEIEAENWKEAANACDQWTLVDWLRPG